MDSKKNSYELLSNKSQLTRKIQIPMSQIGNNINELLKKKLSKNLEGKCSVEGYIINNSIEITTYSSGSLVDSNVEFQVVFECSIINPVEGMIISCTAENVTKAGIKAKSDIDNDSPLVIFISRDHNYSNSKFNEVKENDNILAKVIGQRYELNDSYISVIAELIGKVNFEKKSIEKKSDKKVSIKRRTKPKIILKD